MKVAIVYYWLVNMRGGEKVLESLCQMYPQADIYTHVYKPEAMSSTINKHTVYTTFINRLPFVDKIYPYYLPLMPMALESLDLTAYDLVISCESGPAKGVIVRPDALHITYAFSPMRYAWDMFHCYWAKTNPIKKAIFHYLMHKIRVWDVTSAARTDYFIADSSFVAQRIHKYYRREAIVIFPPVNNSQFIPVTAPSCDYYLWVGEFSPYKRPRDIVEAFNQNQKKIIMIGKGSEKKELIKMASPNVIFQENISAEKLVHYMQNCKALLFPGTEDFGITPLEAMACGRPVIAHQSGGAKDTVKHLTSGFLYQQQDGIGLNEAIEAFEKISAQYNPDTIREYSEQFNEQQFTTKLSAFINNKLPLEQN